MANRPTGYGLTAELSRKIAGKYSEDDEREARDWINAVLGRSVMSGTIGMREFKEELKDGIILCNLINAVKPGSVRKVNESKMAFKQMENISTFLSACEGLGVKKTDLFQTVDLYEGTNMPQVICGLQALGRKAGAIGYNGPSYGGKEATENRRTFTEDQLRAGEGIIGLQAGTNKGASQAGQSFGKTRMIID